MSFASKRELLVQVAPRYRKVGNPEKTVILDQFVAATGYARKYAIRLLQQPMPLASKEIRRPRERRYGKEVQEALAIAWTAANCICGKRLVPFLPELVPLLEGHGHLVLTEEVRSQLLAISPATADRILSALRPEARRRGTTTTRSGLLLKQQVPVRTFADWNEAQPGFFEGDVVAHCGNSAEGLFLWSLVLTDVATGWTECLALRYRSQEAVIAALERMRQLLPFHLLGFDTDNGGEFINYGVLAYCEREEITFTRGRISKKNDQCFVEQKNGSIVRQLVGYDRYEGEAAYRQLAELYRAARLYVNFFQPCMKLAEKQRKGSKVQRKYDAAQTPFQRLIASGTLAAETVQHWTQVFRALDPVRLLQQIQTLQDALWRHALPESSTAGAQTAAQHVRFDLQACLPGGDDNDTGLASTAETTVRVQKRKYRRTEKSLRPRTYRTHPDPFEAVKSELHQWFLAAPDRPVKFLLQELQAHYPGQYPDHLLRTLQRRVSKWRREVILAFDDGLLREDALLNQSLPAPLRALPMPGSTLAENGHEESDCWVTF
jgi:hypothetical protein